MYRQRTYRAGGKVRTQSKYLGPAGAADRRRALRIDAIEEPDAQPIEVVDRTTRERDPPASLEIESGVRNREDLSTQSLEREEVQVKDLMRREGLNTTNLVSIRLRLGSSIGRAMRNDAYEVRATRSGQRNAFKREFRRALAERWVDTLREQDPERYALLCDSLSGVHDWTISGVKPAWLSFLVDLWHRRRRGHHVAIEMAAEAIQRGAGETQQKYYKASAKSEKEAERAWRRFRQLKQPAARKRHFEKCKKLDAKDKALCEKYEQAMWVRYYLFGEKPIASVRYSAAQFSFRAQRSS